MALDRKITMQIWLKKQLKNWSASALNQLINALFHLFFPFAVEKLLTSWKRRFLPSNSINSTCTPVQIHNNYCSQIILLKRFTFIVVIGQDSCKGDSGGPLIAKQAKTGLMYLRGIVSFGTQTCGKGYPGVYTNVQNYVTWILSHLEQWKSENECPNKQLNSINVINLI